MPNTGQVHEHLIGLNLSLQHAVNTAVHVDPSEGSLNLPALAAILLFTSLTRRKIWHMLIASNKDRDDLSCPTGSPERIAVIALVCAHPLRPPALSVNADPINRLEGVVLVMAVGLTDCIGERVAIGVTRE